MALRLSTQSGNTHSAPFAFGSAVADGDQLQITNAAHAVTFNANCTVGISVCTQHPTRPAFTIISSGGSLPTGTYTARLVARGSTGSANPSGATGALIISAAGQFPRFTIPALTPGATAYDLYLTNVGAAVGTERRYATNLAPGTFDATSANWENGTVGYASAAALPFGAGFGYLPTVTSHTGGVAIAAGVTVTAKGDFYHLGNLTLNAGSILEFDAGSSPSGLAVYREWFGSQDASGTPKLVMRGTPASRAQVRGKSGTTQPVLLFATQFATQSNVYLDLEGGRFTRLGNSTTAALNCRNTAAFINLMTDVVFDANCYSFDINNIGASGGWNFTRVTFYQTQGQTYASRTCCASFNITADPGVGIVRNCNTVIAHALPLAYRGGTWNNCYMHDGYARNTGGALSVPSHFSNTFIRKLHPGGGGGGVDTLPSIGETSGLNYLYNDWITGPAVSDLNPHGFAVDAGGAGTTRTLDGWTFEYNGDDDSGDMWKTPSGIGTIDIIRSLIVPNRSNKSTGTLFTAGATTTGLKLRFFHCTSMFGPYPQISTGEGGVPAAQTLVFKSNLGFNIAGTGSNRFPIGHNTGAGATSYVDHAAPEDVSHNAYFNTGAVTSDPAVYSPYNLKFSSPPGASDLDLGDVTGANIAVDGPAFVDPTRKFITWAETILGATGTEAQKIQKGLDTLRAMGDTTNVNYVAGVTVAAMCAWVRAGWAPTAAALNPAANPGHDGLTRGAIDWVDTGAPPPTPGRPYARSIFNARNSKVTTFGI